MPTCFKCSREMSFVRSEKLVTKNLHPGTSAMMHHYRHPTLALVATAIRAGSFIANQIWYSDVYKCYSCDVETTEARLK